LRHQHLRLGAGQFFGDISVSLRRARRSAIVTAVMPTRLLVLDAFDLHGLMDRQPEPAARIEETARETLGHELHTTAMLSPKSYSASSLVMFCR
jgi:voltage-gated potassium channel